MLFLRALPLSLLLLYTHSHVITLIWLCIAIHFGHQVLNLPLSTLAESSADMGLYLSLHYETMFGTLLFPSLYFSLTRDGFNTYQYIHVRSCRGDVDWASGADSDLSRGESEL